MTSICVRDLHKRYKSRDGEVPALVSVDLDVKEGEFVTIVGPSGCGKSTLLYILGGFIGADEGRIEVEGKAVSLTRREWAVLECLSLNIGRVVAKDRLLQAIANWDEDIGANAIEVYVSRLRTKLGGSAPIRTVRGLGYRLDDTAG